MHKLVGTVYHYYNRIGVAVINLTGRLKVGDTIVILGYTSDFSQEILSMEINHQKKVSVGVGDNVAIQVDEPVRRGDKVYLVTEKVTELSLAA